MDILNQTLNSFSTQIVDSGISLQFDLFDSNIINLSILVGGLFYLLSGGLSESLLERQQRILTAIGESEEKLQEATTRLTDGEAKLEQAQLVIEEIQKDSQQIAEQVKDAIITDGKSEVGRLTAFARSQIDKIEIRMRQQISKYVATLLIQRITLRLQSSSSLSLQQQIIDRNISSLAE
jgi:F-type H+-transporting ATPase subunit b